MKIALESILNHTTRIGRKLTNIGRIGIAATSIFMYSSCGSEFPTNKEDLLTATPIGLCSVPSEEQIEAMKQCIAIESPYSEYIKKGEAEEPTFKSLTAEETGLPIGDFCYSIAAGDFNGDLLTDVAIMGCTNENGIWLNKQEGESFRYERADVNITSGGFDILGKIDVNQDGIEELIAASNRTGISLISYNNGVFNIEPLIDTSYIEENYGIYNRIGAVATFELEDTTAVIISRGSQNGATGPGTHDPQAKNLVFGLRDGYLEEITDNISEEMNYWGEGNTRTTSVYDDGFRRGISPGNDGGPTGAFGYYTGIRDGTHFFNIFSYPQNYDKRYCDVMGSVIDLECKLSDDGKYIDELLSHWRSCTGHTSLIKINHRKPYPPEDQEDKIDFINRKVGWGVLKMDMNGPNEAGIVVLNGRSGGSFMGTPMIEDINSKYISYFEPQFLQGDSRLAVRYNERIITASMGTENIFGVKLDYDMDGCPDLIATPIGLPPKPDFSRGDTGLLFLRGECVGDRIGFRVPPYTRAIQFEFYNIETGERNLDVDIVKTDFNEASDGDSLSITKGFGSNYLKNVFLIGRKSGSEEVLKYKVIPPEDGFKRNASYIIQCEK